MLIWKVLPSKQFVCVCWQIESVHSLQDLLLNRSSQSLCIICTSAVAVVVVGGDLCITMYSKVVYDATDFKTDDNLTVHRLQ